MKKSLGLSLCAVITSLALSSPAWAVVELDTGGSLGSNGWTITPIDLNLTGNPDGVTNSLGGNMIIFDGIMNTPQAATCLELETSPGGTANPDTRIFVSDHGTQRSINDDFGGTLQSKARIWFNPGAVSLDWVSYVGAFSSSHNSESFKLRYTRRDISESACTTGQSVIPWAKFVGGGSSYTITLSPNAT